MRRKLGSIISEPIESLIENGEIDRLVLIETDKAAALKTRAAALMYIGRHDLGLTTAVVNNEIWIMKHKDVMDVSTYVDLR